MHSFHHSRGRILFEVLCAFGISASCVAAWMDLGTTALLSAAAVTALYGFVHLFDMRRPKPGVAVDVAEVATETQARPFTYLGTPETEPFNEPELALVEPVEEPELELAEPLEVPEPEGAEVADELQPEAVEPLDQTQPETLEVVEESAPVVEFVDEAPTRKSRRKPSPEVVSPVEEPQSEPEVAETVEEAELQIAETVEEAEPAEPAAHDDTEDHPPVVPLFEPEPFARKQRAVFGRRRKAG